MVREAGIEGSNGNSHDDIVMRLDMVRQGALRS
jgi:hypothetical protein